MPSISRAFSEESISFSLRGFEAACAVPDGVLPPLRVSAGASTIVFHSPHAGQRPIHLGLSLPQEVQYQSVFAVFAIGAKITIF